MTHRAEAAAEAALARIADYDAIQTQTWIARLPDDEILARARAVDRRAAAGEAAPLAGTFFAVKDNLDLAGLPTTAACPAFAYHPSQDAACVSALIGAGAIPVGKTNLDQFATGLVGTRSPHGAPGCAFNRARISGGSSSGSAVAVAAGLVDFALGSDTAGSGRVPAALNGLIGFKPTFGRWNAQGLVPACRSLDCVSLFTSDLAAVGAIDACLAGADASPPPAPMGILGVPRLADLSFFGDGDGEALFEAALVRARAAGLTVVEIDIAPLLACGRLLYDGPWLAERLEAAGPLLRDRPSTLNPVVRAIIAGGCGFSAEDMAEGRRTLAGYRRTAEALMTRIDALLLPTAATAPTIAGVLAEPFELNARLGIYTSFVNPLQMAAIALPAGWRSDATGFGVSLIGPAQSEHRLLALASRLAAPHEPPPLDRTAPAPSVKLAVVGAHLAGMPLHHQLVSRNARLVAASRTASVYRLYAMAGSAPMKPALVHVGNGGAAIAVEVYELGLAEFGAFVAEVTPPLAIGTVTLESGDTVKGFVAEPRATDGARDITRFGGWRAFLAQG